MRLSGPARKLLLSPSRCAVNSGRQQSSSSSASRVKSFSGRRQHTAAQFKSSGDASRISAIYSSPDNHALEVEWLDGKRSNFPYVWLRDCAVEDKPADPTELHASLEPQRQVLDKDGTKVAITWPPYLRSEYTADWLRERAPEDQHQSSALLEGQYATLLQENGGTQLWSKTNHPPIGNAPAHPTYEQIVTDSQVAKQSLISFLKYGVIRIATAPDGATADELMAALGIEGRRLEYNVRKRQAHEAVRLQTSCCELENIPEIIMIKYNEDGDGLDQLSDSFAVARELRQTQPVAFSSLVNNEQLYMSRMNKPFEAVHPAIKLDANGEVVQVIYNNEMRHPEEQVAPGEHSLAVYDSIRNMMITAYKKDYRVDIAPNKSGMVVFNNHRLMHGRTGYAATTFDRADYCFWQCTK